MQTPGILAGRVTKAKKIRPEASSPEEPWASPRSLLETDEAFNQRRVGEVKRGGSSSQWREGGGLWHGGVGIIEGTKKER